MCELVQRVETTLGFLFALLNRRRVCNITRHNCIYTALQEHTTVDLAQSTILVTTMQPPKYELAHVSTLRFPGTVCRTELWVERKEGSAPLRTVREEVRPSDVPVPPMAPIPPVAAQPAQSPS